MKKVVFSFLLLAITFGANHAYAQKCNFDKDEVDGFSKEHVRSVKHNFGNMRKMWVLIMEQTGPNYFLTMNMAEVGKFDDIALAGSKMMFQLENGTVLEIPVVADVAPSVQILGTNMNTQWLIKGSVTAEQLQKMAESPVTAFRIKMGGKDYNGPEFKDKQAEKIMKSAGCLLQKD